MASPKAIYTIDQLAAETDVSRRTIRLWIEKGLVPKSYPPADPGDSRSPRYGNEHLRRIRRLKRWRENRITNADLAERIKIMGDRALDIPND